MARRIVEGLNVADVLRYYGAVSVPTGAGWKPVKCPFHSDGVKSGSVNVDRNLYNCHACPYGGDPIDLIKRKEQLDYGEAVEFTRKVFGKGIEGISRATDKPKQRKPLGRNKWKEILD